MLFLAILGVNIVKVTALNNNLYRIDPSEKGYSGWDLPKKIAIYYDPNCDLLTSTAFNTFTSVSLVYLNTYIIAVTNWKHLQYNIMDREYWIKLYFINGSLQGVNIGEEIVSWKKIADTLSKNQFSYHIFGSGATNLLRNEVPVEQTNVRIEGSQVIGAEQSYFFNLWEVGEILDKKENGIAYERCAEDFRILGIEYFGRNMNRLINGVIDPENIPDPLGEYDDEARLRNWNAKLAKMTDAYQILPDNSTRCFNDTTTPIPQTSLRIYNTKETESVQDDFTITDIPLFSGLEGASADIIDTVLNVLIKLGGNKLGIDPEVATDIVNTIKQLGMLLADSSEGGGDVKKTIKGLLESIMAIAPIPEIMKPFIPVVVDALYLLRGDVDDILDLAKSTITAIFSVASTAVNSTTIQSILQILEATLMNGVEIADRLINKTTLELVDEPISEIVSFATEKVLNMSTWSWVKEVYGGFTNKSKKTATNLVSFLTPLAKGFIFGDLEALLQGIPNVVEYILMKFNDNTTLTAKEKSALDAIGRFYSLGLTLFDNFNDSCGTLSFYTSKKTIITIKDFIASAMTFLGESTSENEIAELAFDIEKVFNDAAISSETDQAVIRSEIETQFRGIGLDTTTDESQALIDAFVILGRIWVPSLPTSVASDFKAVMKDFIDFSTENDTLAENKQEIISSILDSVFGFIAITTDGTAAQMLLTDDVSGLSGENQDSDKQAKFADKIKKAIVTLLEFFVDSPNIESAVNVLAELLLTVAQTLISGEGNSLLNMFRVLAMQAGTIFFDSYLGVDGTVAMRIIQNIFTALVGPNILGGYSVYNETETQEDLKYLVVDSLEKNFPGISQSTLKLAETGVGILFKIKGLFTDGVDFIINEFKAALSQYIAELLGEMTEKLAKKIEEMAVLTVGGKIPFAGADYIGIELEFELSISLGVEWKNDEFVEYIEEIIYKGLTDFELDVGAFFKKIIEFVIFAPVFSARLEATMASTGKGGLFDAILSSLGLELEVSGEVFFSIQLFKFEAGGFPAEEAMKLLEWKLAIYIKVSREFTLFDIITGGAAGGPLNKVAKYIGLDKLGVTLWLSIAFEIGQKAAHNGEPAQGALTLILGIGASVGIKLDLYIVAIGVEFGIDIELTFFQDLTPGVSAPFVITLNITLWVNVVMEFLFFGWDMGFSWNPPGFPLDLSPSRGSQDLEDNALGLDTDNDGLSDDLENTIPSCDPNNSDTDGDGLSDKFELKVSNTEPNMPDTDADGLSDMVEWVLKTNPRHPDTDIDGMTDFEEVIEYGTDPFSRDTDNDGLTDFYEITHAWNLTGITPSVTEIQIGNTIYNDRTDPLNPDTDNDLLLDGQEGEFGPYYGDRENYPDGSDRPMLVFGSGYTHPLDNDTDDDSFTQYWDGSIAGTSVTRTYLRDMRDGIEVQGIAATVVEIDPDGFRELVSKVFQTNPCNPDSDGDSAATSRTRVLGRFLNSDGYELSLNPASDPLDSDTDDDGLIDGKEGTLQPEREFTTYYANPDTDGDSLPDGIEIFLGTNPSKSDTDDDLILDGDEWFRYFTDPLYPDTDYDGVDDYWELFFSHSNPHSSDSDIDGITDYEEIYVYGTDPVDEDSDNDDITDRDELLAYDTDPMDYDSDQDGLRDGEEVFIYRTNPNSKDSDGDSLLFPDAQGNPTFSLSDYDEIFTYGTNPCSMDSDNDSLMDSWELYLRYGDFSAISQENILLNPINNDTDNDGINDGRELVIDPIEILIHPFIGYVVVLPFRSSPVKADTDGDKLGDKYEIDNHLRPDLPDSDNDTISDYDEIQYHKTDPTKRDTDGDGILDCNETTALGKETTSGWGARISTYNPQYATSAFDPDSDDDGWPDGLEVDAIDGDPLYDPYNPDVNNNGIPDGYERDFDHDLLSDGAEYFIYNSYKMDGGFLDYRNPDSDFDGLMDGEEVLIYGTQPYNADTDYDGYSDSLELWIGTDPLVFTSPEEFLAEVNRLTSPLQFKSPEHRGTYNAGPINIEMFNLTALENVQFRYQEIKNATESNETESIGWSDNYTMTYKGFSRWTHKALTFEEGKYELQVVGLAFNYSYPATPDIVFENKSLMNTIIFSVTPAEKPEVDLGAVILIAAGALTLVSAIGIAAFLIRRKGGLDFFKR